jgi:hypothetical protein
MGKKTIEERVVSAAESALATDKYVSAIEVMARIGWLQQARIDEWRQGRLPYLEAGIQAGLGKVSEAMRVFRKWAVGKGLTPSETVYVARTRDRRPLRFIQKWRRRNRTRLPDPLGVTGTFGGEVGAQGGARRVPRARCHLGAARMDMREMRRRG